MTEQQKKEIIQRGLKTEKLEALDDLLRIQEETRSGKIVMLKEALQRSKDSIQMKQNEYRKEDPTKSALILDNIARAKIEIETIKETLATMREEGTHYRDEKTDKALADLKQEYHENRDELKKQMDGEIKRFLDAVEAIKEVYTNSIMIVVANEIYLREAINALNELQNLDKYRPENGWGNPEPRHARQQTIYGESMNDFFQLGDIPNYFDLFGGHAAEISNFIVTIRALRM